MVSEWQDSAVAATGRALASVGWDFTTARSRRGHFACVTTYPGDRRASLAIWLTAFEPPAAGQPLPAMLRARVPARWRCEIAAARPGAILAWWHRVGVFAALDPRRLAGSERTSCVLTRTQVVADGYVNAFAAGPGPAGGVLAFVPGILPHYLRDREELHDIATSPEMSAALNRSVSRARWPLDDAPCLAGCLERSAVLRIFMAVRAWGFRERVLTAYSGRCAVCAELRADVSVARIVPADAPWSSTETCNGMALCPTHHRAYDRALITVDPEYRVVLSESRFAELSEADLAGGADGFRERLRAVIVLPPEHALRPRREFLHAGSALRGWVP